MTISIQSVQSLQITLKSNNHTLGTGTGFIVTKGTDHYLITNWHNFSGINPESSAILHTSGAIPDQITIRHNSNQLGTWIEKTENLYLDEEKINPAWIEHPFYGRKVDVAALKLTEFKDVKIYEYKYGPSINGPLIAPSDSISVIGFPFGLSSNGLAIWATGFMASEPEIDHENLPLFLIDCRTRKGQSGSPVVFHRNDGLLKKADGSVHLKQGSVSMLLGIYSGRINSESDIGKVWKQSVISEILNFTTHTSPSISS